MISAAVLLTFFQEIDETPLVVRSIIGRTHFELKSQVPDPQYENIALNRRLTFRFGIKDSDKEALSSIDSYDRTIVHTRKPKQRNYSDSLYSGLTIGDDYRNIDNGIVLQLLTVKGPSVAFVQLSRIKTSRPGVDPLPISVPEERKLIEGIARWLLANTDLLTLRPATITFDGARYPGLKRSDASEYVSLLVWCERSQIRAKVDRSLGSVSFATTEGKNFATIPLACYQAKLGDKIIDIPAPMVAKDAQPYVDVRVAKMIREWGEKAKA